eukprot:gene11528-4781_t
MLKAPLDENDEYVKSFTIEETEDYLNFFHKYGFVCIRDVLTEDEIKNSVEDIYQYLESGQWNRLFVQDDPKEFKTNIKISDKSTWLKGWPAMKEEGILGVPSVFTKQAFENRQNEKIYKIFSTILHRKDLLVNIDRYGFFRPTKNVEIEKGKFEDFPQWKTQSNLHLDMNPWDYFSNFNSKSETFSSYNCLANFCSENNEGGTSNDKTIRVQGLVNLLDNHEEDGGFTLVPGNHLLLGEWTKKNLRKGNGMFNVISKKDEIHQYAQRITAKAGTLIIWDHRMTHGSNSNDSDKMRLAQFIKMFTKPKNDMTARQKVLKKMMEENQFEMSELGEKLFGFKDWN